MKMSLIALRLMSYAALPLALLGCGGGTTAPAYDPNITTATFASSLGVNLAASTKTADGLYYRDTNPGTGAVVGATDSIAVHYTAYLEDGTIVDYNAASQTPLGFRLGQGTVIKGWDEGIPGMLVGGTRQLIIPYTLGYGTVQYGQVPAYSILVFSVWVVAKY